MGASGTRVPMEVWADARSLSASTRCAGFCFSAGFIVSASRGAHTLTHTLTHTQHQPVCWILFYRRLHCVLFQRSDALSFPLGNHIYYDALTHALIDCERL